MINVSCGIIIRDNKILLAQRSELMVHPLKWEFPGGKQQNKETLENSLQRELKEELNIEIDILQPLKSVEYQYPDINIKLHPFICSYISGEINLLEHKQIAWVRPSKLLSYDLAGADIIVAKNLSDDLLYFGVS